MVASFIVRLLDSDGGLLAWAEVLAESRPRGRPRSTPFRAQAPTLFSIERDGIAVGLSVHWADLDVARYTPLMNPGPVKAGQVQRFDWIEPVWMVAGSGSDVMSANEVNAARQRMMNGEHPMMVWADIDAQAARRRDVPLPPVTVGRPVNIEVPIGSLLARTN